VCYYLLLAALSKGRRMAVSVDVYTWPAIVLAPGQQLTFIHWIVDQYGNSMIDPEHWHLMSSVPDYVDVRPDRPVPAASVEILSQGGTRDRVLEPGPSNINWLATWQNPDTSNFVTFRPHMVIAPAL
jgi:hypothetical protein